MFFDANYTPRVASCCGLYLSSVKRKERQLFPTSTAKPPERTSVANHYELEQEVVSSAHDVVHPDIIFSWRVGTAGKIDPHRESQSNKRNYRARVS